MATWLRLLLWCLFLAAKSGIAAWGQQFQGDMTGTVTDETGALIPGVGITATQQGTGLIRTVESRPDGWYEIPLLPPGLYKLVAEKPNFQKFEQGPLELLVDQHLQLDITMRVGSHTTSITVESPPPVVDTQTSAVGTTIEQQKVKQLPLNGRNFLQLTLFTPGVVPGTAGSENSTRGGAINVNGLRESMNSYLLDGISNTSVAVGTYTVSPPLDSVQEFRMETGVYEAKFGTHAGAQVNVVTKSGTNQLHGSAYEFLRNSALDARNFFDPTVPPFKRNQFGASLGGPVLLPGYNGRDRTFFFLAYEGLRERRDIFEQSRVPTLAERAGNFLGTLAPDCATKNLLLNPLVIADPRAPLTVPNNDLNNLLPFFPTGTLDQSGQAFVGLYPAPNIPGAGCGSANYIAERNRIIDTDSYVARVDHRWGSKDNMFFRYLVTTDREFRPYNGGSNLPGYGIHAHDVDQAGGLDWTHILSSSLFNEAKVGYNRWTESLVNEDRGNSFSKDLGIVGLPDDPSKMGVPRINFAGYDALGAQTDNPQHGAVNNFQFSDTVTALHANHILSLGFDIRSTKRGNFTRDITIRGQYDFTGVTTGKVVLGALQQQLPPPVFAAIVQQLFQACPPGSCTFGNGLADALFGLPQDWINGFEANVSGVGTTWDYFLQDTWKVRPRLTLNLGVRYEYNNLVTDKYDRFSNFDFSNTSCGFAGALLVAGRSAATVECPEVIPSTGVVTFVPVGTRDLGSTAMNRALQLPDRNNFAPRIGFAWQPFTNTKTVVRGGYGVFYDRTFGDVYFQRAQNPPFVQVSAGRIDRALPPLLPVLCIGPNLGSCQPGQVPLGSGAFIQNAFALAAVPLFPTISPFQMTFQDSVIQGWAFDVQRELPASWLLDLGYLGTRGMRLPRKTDPNQPNITRALTEGLIDPVTGLPLPQSRRFPNFDQNFVYTESSGSSIYHALQVKVERHFSGGLAVLAAYTYAHSIDTNSTFGSTDLNANAPQNSYDLAAEKASSDFDFRHRFSLSYIYDLPFGRAWRAKSSALNYSISDWELAGIVTAQTGSPFTPVISGDVSCTAEDSNFGSISDRPNLVGKPYPAHQTVDQWVLPSAFADPRVQPNGSLQPCGFGNAGRNILRGPGLAVWDFSLLRRFHLTESKTLEFRAEMFNLFNRANFATPERDVAAASFGKIFNTVQPIAGLASGGPGDPREIQFALRLVW